MTCWWFLPHTERRAPCVAVCCSVLQDERRAPRVAILCSLLQRVAASCSVLQFERRAPRIAPAYRACRSVLQCDAVWGMSHNVLCAAPFFRIMKRVTHWEDLSHMNCCSEHQPTLFAAALQCVTGRCSMVPACFSDNHTESAAVSPELPLDWVRGRLRECRLLQWGCSVVAVWLQSLGQCCGAGELERARGRCSWLSLISSGILLFVVSCPMMASGNSVAARTTRLIESLKVGVEEAVRGEGGL